MTCFWDEFIGTALLLIGLLSLLDKRNGLSPGLVAIGFFFIFVGIAACFGMQTGFAVNPARDLGPRIFTSMVGYGVQVYNLRKYDISKNSRFMTDWACLKAILVMESCFCHDHGRTIWDHDIRCILGHGRPVHCH